MALVISTLAVTGCGGGTDSGSTELAGLSDEFWQWNLKNNPISATSLGDRRYDAFLSDNSPQGIASRRAELQKFLAAAESIEPDGLDSEDRLTRLMLVTELNERLARIDCKMYEWVVDPLRGPQVSYMSIEALQPIRSAQEGADMVKRWQLLGPQLDQHIENLRIGLAENKVAVGAGVKKSIVQLKETLAKSDEEWALLNPLKTEHDDWTDEEWSEFETAMRTAVKDQVRPAYERYLAFLQDDVLPVARPNDKPGLVHMPDGLHCYDKLIIVHTSLALPPDEIHEIGLGEVAKINAEMEDLGEKLFGTRDRQQIIKRLRTDPELYFSTRDEIEEKAVSALARAKAAMPEWFGILPQTDCDVVRMKAFEEKHSTIAYYRQPALDGSRPGSYYINTYAPETRPRYEAEALAYHEAIPGHHLQIAISQELTDIPDFRKHTGVTAYVEGWALYTERLSDEMGLYTDDLDRMGMLSYDAWRACRLVVDTGMHAKGWTRDQAIEFMMENTALARNNIVNEVDRYITWPGQALAYKIGQMEIFRLRAQAREALGDNFDIRKFHDVVLQNGAVGLEPLREAVAEYIQQSTAAASAETSGRTTG